jgi:hypothetical protein
MADPLEDCRYSTVTFVAAGDCTSSAALALPATSRNPSVIPKAIRVRATWRDR